MDCNYEACIIKHTLEMSKDRLEKAVNGDYARLLNAAIIKLSQNLDALVVRCTKCKNTKKIIDILDIDNTPGRHSMFFYYGKEHLLVCLAKYLKDGIEKNEFCPVFLQPDWYQSLCQYLEQNNFPLQNVQYYPVNEMLTSFLRGGSQGFKQQVLELSQWTKDAGYSGIRMIGQCSYAIRLSSKSDFLKFEKAINDAFSGIAIAGLCVYDFYDFINTSTYIEDEIFNDSYATHTNMLAYKKA